MSGKITAPWTPEQVDALNAYQRLGYVHEFTCPHGENHQDRILVATASGWRCRWCDYTQDWAHDFMADKAKHPKPPFAPLVVTAPPDKTDTDKVRLIAQNFAYPGQVEAIVKVADDLDEHRRSFDMRWNADMRAIKLWQAAHPGNENVWPDHADLCVWLMEQYDEKIEAHQEALQRISQWADAYPVDVFPEPDLAKAAKLLNDGGISIDAVSAHCMRHVIAGVGAIAKKALGEDQ